MNRIAMAVAFGNYFTMTIFFLAILLAALLLILIFVTVISRAVFNHRERKKNSALLALSRERDAKAVENKDAKKEEQINPKNTSDADDASQT